MNTNNGIPFSKMGQRKISSFVGQELLYDYVTDQLDFERKKAVKAYLNENEAAQTEIQKIQNGIKYSQLLAKTQISEVLREKVKQPTSYFQAILQRIHFADWPPPARMGLEACLVACGITAFAVLIPWSRFWDIKWQSSQVVLSEIDNQLATKTPKETEVGAKEQFSFPDEGSGSEAVKVTTTTLKPAEEAMPTASTEPIPVTAVATAKQVSAEPKATGFLYRGTISMTNPKVVAVKIVEKITALGARKAGNVELGWSKGSGAYFHFTMPETKYDETLETFKDYGELKIQKEKHERVMPDGIIRLIIDAEEKK